jgi:hypothetical protein
MEVARGISVGLYQDFIEHGFTQEETDIQFFLAESQRRQDFFHFCISGLLPMSNKNTI